MVIAYTGDEGRARAAASRLRLALDELVLAGPPPRLWWLVPPPELLDLIGESRGAQVFVTAIPSSPLVAAVLEVAAELGGVQLTQCPRVPRWILEPARLVVRQSRPEGPEGWHELALSLRRNGCSIRKIAEELQRRATAGEIRGAPSSSSVHRFLASEAPGTA